MFSTRGEGGGKRGNGRQASQCLRAFPNRDAFAEFSAAAERRAAAVREPAVRAGGGARRAVPPLPPLSRGAVQRGHCNGMEWNNYGSARTLIRAKRARGARRGGDGLVDDSCSTRSGINPWDTVCVKSGNRNSRDPKSISRKSSCPDGVCLGTVNRVRICGIADRHPRNR
eukprot:gene16078-biopygen291